MSYDFRNYLKAAGLGESAPVRRRKVNVKPKAFNAIAFAESYKFIAEDGKRMALSNNRLNNELRRTAAKGEAGAEEFKEKLKSGMAKVKKVLIELYDKIIRFFTETVRYWMSNERKVAKVIAQLRNAKKVSGKKDKFSVPVSAYGEIRKGRKESFGSFGEREYELGDKSPDDVYNDGVSAGAASRDGEVAAKDQTISKLTADIASLEAKYKKARAIINRQNAKANDLTKRLNTLKERAKYLFKSKREVQAQLDSISKETKVFVVEAQKDNLTPAISVPAVAEVSSSRFDLMIELLSNVEADKDSNLDEIKELCSSLTESFRTTNKEILEDLKPVEGGNITIDRKNYEEIVDLYIELLGNSKGGTNGMQSLNKNIRRYTSELRALKEKFKGNEDPSEEETLKYQAKRVAIQTQSTITNLFIGFNDKITGYIVNLGGRVASAA